MNTKLAPNWLMMVCWLCLAGAALTAEVSKSQAEKMGVTWVYRGEREIGNIKATVIEFTNADAKQQYTLKFKISYSGSNSQTNNSSMVSKKEYKVVLEPASKQEVPVSDAPGFGFSSTPSVISLSITRTNTKRK